MADKSKQTIKEGKADVQEMGEKELEKKKETKKQENISKTGTKKTKETTEKSKKTEKTGKSPDKKEEKKNRDDLASAKEKIAEFQDKYIRLSADFDNYRKRTLKEKIELTKSANSELLLNLLPIMDDFERALKSIEEENECKALKDGIDLIYSKFRDFLKSSGVKEIDAMHKQFDTDIHEAVTKIPVPKKKLKGKVVDVIQKGYYLNEKIIRYPKVVVGE